MPACRDCLHFSAEAGDCTLNVKGRCALRNCVFAVQQKYRPVMRGRVLEVGYGAWPFPRRRLQRDRRRRVQWHGVDPRFPTIAAAGRYQGTVAHLPFEPDYFDVGLAFETMEHWTEYLETPRQGLAELHRVLKPGALLVVTVPIHLHGAPEFVRGDVATILDYFEPHRWRELRAEPWRRDFAPCAPCLNWLMDGSRETRRQVVDASAQRVPSSWTLEITARKAA